MKEYKLVPVKDVVVRNRRGIYVKMFKEFLSSEHDFVEVQIEGKTAISLQASLYAQIAKHQKGKIQVIKSGEHVYLKKLKENNKGEVS